MAPGPDTRRRCNPDGTPPRSHVWAVRRRPGGTLEVEVCFRCHEPNWERLDAQIRVFAEKLTQKVTERIVGMLAEEPPHPAGPPLTVVDAPPP